MIISRRQLILREVKRRLQAITVANGFNTDAGLSVRMGFIPMLGPDDVRQVIAIIPREDQVIPSGGLSLSLRLPIDIHALVDAAEQEPWESVELMLTDLKRAMELPDLSLGGMVHGGNNIHGLHRGTTEVFERRSGTDPIGAVVTYVAPYAEVWGNPQMATEPRIETA